MHVGELFPGFRVLGCSAVPRHAQLRPLDRRGRGRGSPQDDPAGAAPPRARQRGAPGDRARQPAEVVELPALGAAPRADDVYLFDGPLHLADLSALGRARTCASTATSRSRRRSCRRCTRTTTSSASSPSATSCCTIRTSRSKPWSSSSPRRPTIPTCSRSSRRSTAPAATRPIVRALIRAAENGKQVTARRRAQGALRRGEQHPVGAHARGGRRARRLRPHRPEDPLQGRAGRAARGRTGIRRYVHLRPATTTRRPRASTPTSRSSPRATPTPTTRPRSSTCSPATRAAVVEAVRRRAARPARPRSSRSSSARRRTGAQAGAHRRQDERARRRGGHRGALPRVAGGRADRAHRARHLLPAPGRARRPATTSGSLSIVDRFLEHARIFHFGNGGKRRGLPLVGRLDAAQLPPPRRGHVPGRGRGLRDRVIDEILAIALRTTSRRGA